MLKNGTSASPAIALANKVLPVPGGPISMTPLGMRPPSFWNFLGSFRNSTISWTSSFSSSMPATLLKVILLRSRLSILARLFPKLIAPWPAERILAIDKEVEQAKEDQDRCHIGHDLPEDDALLRRREADAVGNQERL